jgi:rusticyanin
MKHARLAAAIAAAAVTAAGLGAGAAITACGASGQAPAAAATPGGSAYSYYRSMMGRLRSSGSAGSMMDGNGYRWMMGGLAAPAWMRGHALPGFMMGTSHDPGKVMGRFWANAPGPRVSPSQATTLGGQIPAGATVSRTRQQVTFSGSSVRLAVVASPAGGPHDRFRVAGMTDPAIVVKSGARVTIQVINADPDTAHGLVVTASSARPARMPMMTARPAFTGSALWFLGNPTAAGMHAGTISFTAAPPGTYHYLCPVPGHAQKGMTGSFTASRTT